MKKKKNFLPILIGALLAMFILPSDNNNTSKLSEDIDQINEPLFAGQTCSYTCGDTATNSYTVTSGGTAPFTYSWFCTNGTSSISQSFTQPIGVNTSFNCFVTVTDADGCQVTDTNVINVIPETCDCNNCIDGVDVTANCSLVLIDFFCGGGGTCNSTTYDQVLVYHSNVNNFGTANLIFTFSWNGSFQTYTPPQNGGYLWHVWKSDCCPDLIETACYSCEPDCEASLSLFEIGTCNQLQAVVDNCGGTPSYLWNTGETTPTINISTNGNYSVTVTGCCVDPMIASVNVDDCVVPCTDPVATISGDCDLLTSSISGFCPGVTYQWFRNGSFVGTNSTLDPQNNSGTYWLIVTCSNGCGDTSNFINLDCTPECLSSPFATVSGCTTITAGINGAPCPGAIYTFIDPNNVNLQSSTSNVYNGTLQDGIYVINISGCPDCPIFQTTVTVSGCTPECDCEPTIVFDQNACTVTGFVNGPDCGNYNTWQIARWNTSVCTIGNTPVANGIIASLPQTINVDTDTGYALAIFSADCPPKDDCVAVTGCECNIDLTVSVNNCVATATPSGGTAPFTYSWQNGLQNTLSNSQAYNVDGTYTVTVTDADGCTSTETFVIFGCEIICDECVDCPDDDFGVDFIPPSSGQITIGQGNGDCNLSVSFSGDLIDCGDCCLDPMIGSSWTVNFYNGSQLINGLPTFSAANSNGGECGPNIVQNVFYFNSVCNWDVGDVIRVELVFNNISGISSPCVLDSAPSPGTVTTIINETMTSALWNACGCI